MNYTDLKKEIANAMGVTHADAGRMLDILVDLILDGVDDGNKISIPKLGTFEGTVRAERKGRNPQTGDEMIIPSSRSMKLKLSKAAKDRLNS
mgnify:CR=1 FL=1